MARKERQMVKRCGDSMVSKVIVDMQKSISKMSTATWEMIFKCSYLASRQKAEKIRMGLIDLLNGLDLAKIGKLQEGGECMRNGFEKIIPELPRPEETSVEGWWKEALQKIHMARTDTDMQTMILWRIPNMMVRLLVQLNILLISEQTVVVEKTAEFTGGGDFFSKSYDGLQRYVGTWFTPAAAPQAQPPR
jgi:hypothetical protein